MRDATPRLRAEDISLNRRTIAFVLLMVFEFFYGWSWNTVDVLRPQIREELGLTLTQAGSAYTAQSLGALIGSVTFGVLADRYGRRPMLIAIIIGTSVAAAAGAYVASYEMLLGQRFILGLFLGGNFPVLIGTYMGLFSSRVRGKLASIGQGTYNVSVIALGAAYGMFAERSDWQLLLLIGSVPSMILAPLIFWLIPDDRKMTAFGADPNEPKNERMPLFELFSPALRRTTWLLFALVALNFFAYQAFAGWTTTFLKDEQGLSSETIGWIISTQFTGALIGGFFWGWFSDRFGRRPTGIGFALGALSVLAYVTIAQTPTAFAIAGFCWGFAITASVAWAPWMSELYPMRVRSSAMSIFNWGRIISMTAPLLTGEIAANFGLKTAMSLGIVGFGLGALVWFALPETVSRRKPATQ
ncbi:MFS transporter [Tsuneonella sp. HG249]